MFPARCLCRSGDGSRANNGTSDQGYQQGDPDDPSLQFEENVHDGRCSSVTLVQHPFFGPLLQQNDMRILHNQ